MQTRRLSIKRRWQSFSRASLADIQRYPSPWGTTQSCFERWDGQRKRTLSSRFKFSFYPCRSIQKLISRGLPIVIIEKAPEAFALLHDCCPGSHHFQRNDKAVLKSLMVPLEVVMHYELSNRMSQCIVTKEDHP